MSERVGKNAQPLQLFTPLKLDPIIQTGIRDGFISMGHGRAIINIEDLDIQTDIYQRIVSQNLSVRDTEALVKNYQESLKPKPAVKTKASSAFEIQETQKKVYFNYFGSKVDVKVAGNGKEKLQFHFNQRKTSESWN
jgi:ParB family chromosome partitioning protein